MSVTGSGPRRVAVASFVGTLIEAYDFFLYGSAAATVFEPLFVPSSDPLSGTLAAFAIFAVGYLFRPVGAALFGQFGDRKGRKSTLIATLLLMGTATFLIGLLPTYQTIGVAAPVLLVLLRLIQGLSVGGEWGGAALMAVEHAPAGKRGTYGSAAQLGAPAGLLLATGMFTAFSSLPEASFLSWGWRVPFLVSAVLIAVGLWIRLRVSESPVFVEMKRSGGGARWPLLEVLRRPRAALVIVALRFIEGVPASIYAFFASSYVVAVLGLPPEVGLTGVTIASAVGLVATPCSGMLSDRLGRRRTYAFAAVYSTIVAFPVFALIDTGSTPLIWLAIVLGMLGAYMVYAPQAALFAELFATDMRYSGASMGAQVGGALTSGLSPLVATALLAAAGGASWPAALLIVGSGLISLVALRFCPRPATGLESTPERGSAPALDRGTVPP